MVNKMKNDIITVIRPCLPAMVNFTERWLRQKAFDGWKLIHNNRCRFVFRRCKPYDGHFLMYSGFDKSKGLSYDYYRIRENYKKSKSEINNQQSYIFEADAAKIDSDYWGFIRTRNKFYLSHYKKLCLFSGLISIIVLCVALVDIRSWFISIVAMVPFLYSLLSLILLKAGT